MRPVKKTQPYRPPHHWCHAHAHARAQEKRSLRAASKRLKEAVDACVTTIVVQLPDKLPGIR